MARKARNEAVEALKACDARGYTPCEWESDGERCRYPGTLSSNTNGGGPHFCRGHFGCADPQMGAYVVQASRDYVHLSIEDRIKRDDAAAAERAQAYLEKHGLSKRPNETSKAYSARLRAHCRVLIDGILKQQKAA